MKALLVLILLALAGMFAWNIFSSRNPSSDVPGSAGSIETDVLDPDSTPTPVPTPTPVLPSSKAYLDALSKVNDQLVQPIGPPNPSEVPGRIYVDEELKELWRVGQQMHQREVFTVSEAQSVVNVIKLMEEIANQRDVFQARYESLYFRYTQKRMGDSRTQSRISFQSVNEDWANYTRTKDERIFRELRELEQATN